MDNDFIPTQKAQDFPREVLIKWLRGLFYIHITSLVLSLISMLPINDTVFIWIQRVLIIGIALCLSQLSLAGDRYRKAALFRLLHAGGILIFALLFQSTAISLAASICSLISIYQEYSAHSELIAGKDPVLSRKWHSLFNWSIVAGVLVSLGSMFLSILSVISGMDMADIVAIVMVVISLPNTVVSVFYLMYLKRTIGLLQPE